MVVPPPSTERYKPRVEGQRKGPCSRERAQREQFTNTGITDPDYPCARACGSVFRFSLR